MTNEEARENEDAIRKILKKIVDTLYEQEELKLPGVGEIDFINNSLGYLLALLMERVAAGIECDYYHNCMREADLRYADLRDK